MTEAARVVRVARAGGPRSRGGTDLRRPVPHPLHRQRSDETTTDLGADELADALAALPPKRRTAVVLRYYAGLDTREIADAMGVRPGTVKSLLHRALAQLREEIER